MAWGEEEEGASLKGGESEKEGGEMAQTYVCELKINHPASEQTVLKPVATASAQLLVYY